MAGRDTWQVAKVPSIHSCKTMEKSTHWFKNFNAQIYTHHVVTFKLGGNYSSLHDLFYSLFTSVYRLGKNPFSFSQGNKYFISILKNRSAL